MMSADDALAFIEEHGAVLVAGKGPAPRLVEAILGEPIEGSWWAHPRSHGIFAVLQALEESHDLLLCCRLIDRKVTLVHRRLWPALVKLEARFTRQQLAQIHQEHTPSGKHVTRNVDFPAWVPQIVRTEARDLSEQEAERLLAPVLMAGAAANRMRRRASSARRTADQASSSVGGLLSIAVHDGLRVSGRLELRPGARACYVLAHGAGAGMDHPFMSAVAAELAERDVATLRFQFPYMERRARRPDPPSLCHATVRAAVAECARIAPELPLIAGGRSFGGRMTSQAQALAPLPAVRGLAFLGFPLHPAGAPSDARAQHLAELRLPLLFIQGTRDALAERALLERLVARLGAGATLKWLEDADHSFHVPARSGRTDAQVRSSMLDALCEWLKGLL